MKCDKKTMLLYAVTDRAWVGKQSLYEQVESALKGGATCVQLREKELELQRQQLDGLDLYAAGKATVNDTFDRYMATKFELRDSTRNGYWYTYDHLI